MCHDRGFHLYRPAPRPSPTERQGLLPDAGRQLWLLFHSSLGVLLLHFHQWPHVHDPEEAQVGFGSPASLPTVWHTRSHNHFVYNHFCGFSSKHIVSFKSFYKKEEREKEEFLPSWSLRPDHKGWHSECKPTESLSKAQQDPAMWNPQDASPQWTWGGVWPKVEKTCFWAQALCRFLPCPSPLALPPCPLHSGSHRWDDEGPE